MALLGRIFGNTMKILLLLSSILISMNLYAGPNEKPMANTPLTSIRSERWVIVEDEVLNLSTFTGFLDMKWSQGYVVAVEVTCTGCSGEIRISAGVLVSDRPVKELYAEIEEITTAIVDSGNYIINVGNVYYNKIKIEVADQSAISTTINVYVTAKLGTK